MDEITIDRLVLDVPGLDARRGRGLAQQIGKGLAAASPKPGTLTRISVDRWATRPRSRKCPRLAARIVELSLGQIG